MGVGYRYENTSSTSKLSKTHVNTAALCTREEEIETHEVKGCAVYHSLSVTGEQSKFTFVFHFITRKKRQVLYVASTYYSENVASVRSGIPNKNVVKTNDVTCAGGTRPCQNLSDK